MEKQFKLHKKPLKNICPEKFCFNWKDSCLLSDSDLKEKSFCNISNLPNSPKCFRETNDLNNIDYYEPNEPELKKANLPSFYFINDINKYNLTEKDKKDYMNYFENE
jgi:hypothetical protein